MPSSREKDQDPDIFIGIGFPLGYSNTGIFTQTKTTIEQAIYNLKNLLLTAKGERLGHPDFGCEIRDLLFEQITTDVQDRVEEKIKESVNTWLPYLSIDEVVVEQLSNRLNVDVKFSLKNDMTAGEAVTVSYAITE
jgi:phage baseplate assembly protein W